MRITNYQEMNKNISNVKNDFLFHCKYEKGLSKKTIKAYEVDINQFINFIKNKYSIQEFESITKEMLKKYLQTMSGFKPKTIKRKIASMKAMFTYYEFENDTFINPIRKIKLRIKETKTLPTVMCINEVELILKYFYEKLDTDSIYNYKHLNLVRNLCIIELLFATGIRVEELCNLQCKDIDLYNGNIKVHGKGGKERIIQICSEEVITILKDYNLIAKPKTFFFINRLGNCISTQSVRLIIKKITKELNLTKNITPHTFRHTFATLLLEENVDIKYIQTLLGHSSIVTTQIYTHINLNKQKEILLNRHPRNKLFIK